MSWIKIPDWIKAIALLISGFWFAINYYQTDVEAAQAHEALAQALEQHLEHEAASRKRERIDRIEEQIMQLRLRLAEEHNTLSEDIKQRIRDDIRILTDKLTCIRNDKC